VRAGWVERPECPAVAFQEVIVSRPPFPPFSRESALQKVQVAEDAWNARDPGRVALAYTQDTVWRNREEFLQGRDAVVDFLTRTWERERRYALRKELGAFTDNPWKAGDRTPLPLR
jgi:uncharacterized protein